MYNPTYPGYYAMNYNQQLYNNQMQNQQPQQNNSLTWVQGEAAAKAYPVASGQSILLMDSEDSVFYIKSIDQSGMPQPLRIFDYTERKSQNNEPKKTTEAVGGEEYVSKTEFNNYKEDMKRLLKKIRGVPAEKAGETNA